MAITIKRSNQRTFTAPDLDLDFTTWVQKVSSVSSLSLFAAARIPVSFRCNKAVVVPSFLEQLELAFLNNTPRLSGTLHLHA